MLGCAGWRDGIKNTGGMGVEEAYVGSCNQGVEDGKEKYPEKLIFLWCALIRKKLEKKNDTG